MITTIEHGDWRGRSLDHEDRAHTVAFGDGLVRGVFERHDAAPTQSLIRGDHDLALGVQNSIPQRRR